jgi:hypothetical protein
MAAGSGFKTFATGDVLTAADTNGYLMQGVWVFADAAARTAAVTSPQEGNMSYLKDTNSTEYYSGSAWVAVAGAAAGSWTLASTTALSTNSTSLTIPTGYKQINIWIENYQITANSSPFYRYNSVSSSTYRGRTNGVYGTSTISTLGGTGTSHPIGEGGSLTTGNNKNMAIITLNDYENTTSYKIAQFWQIQQDVTGYANMLNQNTYAWLDTSAITTLQLIAGSSTWAGGTAYVYGVK